MRSSHNAHKWVFALAPHRPPVFRSTYLGPPRNLKLARAILGAPLLQAWHAMGSFFYRFTKNIHRIARSYSPRSIGVLEDLGRRGLKVAQTKCSNCIRCQLREGCP